MCIVLYSCNAFCHACAPRVYNIRIGYCMLVFIILPVLWGIYVAGITIKVCALSLYILIV